jgi:hypothetical protein
VCMCVRMKYLLSYVGTALPRVDNNCMHVCVCVCVCAYKYYACTSTYRIHAIYGVVQIHGCSRTGHNTLTSFHTHMLTHRYIHINSYTQIYLGAQIHGNTRTAHDSLSSLHIPRQQKRVYFIAQNVAKRGQLDEFASRRRANLYRHRGAC